MEKNFPLKCPSCSHELKVVKLHCEQCDTHVSGSYDLPVLAKLDLKDQQIIVEFVKASGSLKVMAQQMGLSYPTVRNILDEIIEKIQKSTKA
jgi:hypothetical protein